MTACAFFGHKDYNYEEYKASIKCSIVELIENYEVTQFYSGGRGKFDNLCAQIVYELKKEYPHIKNTLVLSYLPQKKEQYGLPEKYDDSVYFLEKKVPPRLAIIKTNEEIVDRVDYVVTAVWRSWGGARRAKEYALRKGKTIVDIYEFFMKQEIKGRRNIHDWIESQGATEKMKAWLRLSEKIKEEGDVKEK